MSGGRRLRLADAVQVPIGGIAVGRPGQVLGALLGSCVGLVVQDLGRQIAVLAHVVRPSGAGDGMGPGYFADRAVPRARDLAIQAGARPRDLVVRVVGGGSMVAGGLGIGARNLAAIKAATPAAGMAFGGQVGGPTDGGCVVVVDPAKGRIAVQRLGSGVLDAAAWERILKELAPA
jgi:chemotaxis protein CheD